MRTIQGETVRRRLEAEYAPYGIKCLPYFRCHGGWERLIRTFLDEACDVSAAHKITIWEIKEKHGALRIYWKPLVDKHAQHHLSLLARRLEEESLEVCEQCGAPGRHRKRGGWHYTVCDPCDHERAFPQS